MEEGVEEEKFGSYKIISVVLKYVVEKKSNRVIGRCKSSMN